MLFHINSRMNIYQKQSLDDILRNFSMPYISGQWGEMQLYRLVELSNCVAYCEYEKQASIENGKPDLIIKLPHKGVIYVDAKTSLHPYFKALQSHKTYKNICKYSYQAVVSHIRDLSNKEYWKCGSSPEMTILFLSCETVWISALKHNNNIIEIAMRKKIVIATPMTLMGILITIRYIWNNSSLFGHNKFHNIISIAKELDNQSNDILNRSNIINSDIQSIHHQIQNILNILK